MTPFFDTNILSYPPAIIQKMPLRDRMDKREMNLPTKGADRISRILQFGLIEALKMNLAHGSDMTGAVLVNDLPTANSSAIDAVAKTSSTIRGSDEVAEGYWQRLESYLVRNPLPAEDNGSDPEVLF